MWVSGGICPAETDKQRGKKLSLPHTPRDSLLPLFSTFYLFILFCYSLRFLRTLPWKKERKQNPLLIARYRPRLVPTQKRSADGSYDHDHCKAPIDTKWIIIIPKSIWWWRFESKYSAERTSVLLIHLRKVGSDLICLVGEKFTKILDHLWHGWTI